MPLLRRFPLAIWCGWTALSVAAFANMTLRPGDSLRGRLETPATGVAEQQFDLEATIGGPTIIEVSSFDLDIWLTVARLDGGNWTALDATDPSATGAHARLHLSVDPGARYRLTIHSLAEFGPGAFELSWRIGDTSESATSKESLTEWQRAGQLAEQQHRPAAVVHALCGEAIAQLQADQQVEARQKAAEAVARAVQTDGSDSWLAAAARRRDGAIAREAGDFAAARSVLADVVALREKLFGAEHLLVAQALNDLGITAARAGQLPSAINAFRRAAAIREQQLGGERLEVAEALNNLGIPLSQSGKWREAIDVIGRALQIREAQLGKNHRLVAQTLTNLASPYRYLGEDDRAVELLTRALAIRQARVGEGEADLVLTQLNMANALRDIGRFAEAKSLYEQALALRRRKLPAGHPSVASSEYLLATLLRLIGSSADAKPMLERALASLEKTVAPDSPQLLNAASSLGLAELALGNLTAAEQRLTQALAIAERGFGRDHVETGFVLIDLARVQQAQGHRSVARTTLDRALELLRAGLEPDHPRLAEALVESARLDVSEARLDPAEAALHESVSIRERRFGGDHPALAESLTELAQLEGQRGQLAAAFEAAQRASAIVQRHNRRTVQALDEERALRFVDGSDRVVELVIALAAREDDPSRRRAALTELIRGRALVLDQLAQRRRAAALSADPAIAALTREHAAAATRYANLVVHTLSGGQVPSASALDEARADQERLAEQLAKKSEPFRAALQRQVPTWEQLQVALGADAALVSFVRLDAAGPQPARYIAGITRQDATAPTFVELGDAARIDRQVDAWWSALTAPGAARGRLATRAERALTALAVPLRRALWDPLRSSIGPAQRVFVVPDGALHLVDFAVLPTDDGHYLVESDRRFAYLAAERDLLAPVGEAIAGTGLLAIGAPAFEGSGAPSPALATNRSAPGRCTGMSDLRFSALPQAAREIEEIAALWRGGTVRTLSGSAADEASFKRAAPGSRVLHLATHGFVLDDRCSAVGLGLEKSRSAARSPLLLSGLALAGANRREADASSAEDGILTAEEIAALDLSGVEWAVLSACDTGRGAIRGGEGVLGLRRAFQVAGVRTVIMSLWPVDDLTARGWMKSLYTARFQAGQSTIDACRTAQLELLRQARRSGGSTHPAAWAGFVAAGDGR